MTRNELEKKRAFLGWLRPRLEERGITGDDLLRHQEAIYERLRKKYGTGEEHKPKEV